MKKIIPLLGTVLIMILFGAKSAPLVSNDIPPSPQSNVGGITNRSGRIFSTAEIQFQLTDLRRAVEQSLPVVSALTERYSNSVANSESSVAGGIAGVLGGVLNRYTNNIAGEASSNTNALGRLLQVLGAAGTNGPSAQVAQFRDLAALQEHLQAMSPILERLGVATNLPVPVDVGGSPDASGVGTGTGRSESRPKQ
jgi:hypothetical protein